MKSLDLRGPCGAAGGLLALCAAALAAPPVPPADPAPRVLAWALEQAWARQPEALAAPARREAAQALREQAGRWTAEAAALEWRSQSDRPVGRSGAREQELGVALPLWRPGARAATAALAEAELQGLDSQARAARWRLAAQLREAWWALRRAEVDRALADDRLDSARRLAADVARRVRAGELARADQHQAEGAEAQAQGAAAEAQGAWAMARQRWQAALGGPEPLALAEPGPGAPDDLGAEPEPGPEAGGPPGPDHPAVAEWRDRWAALRGAAGLAAAQAGSAPELTLATSRGRDARGEAYQPSLTLGLRWPLGSGPLQQARVARAQAEALEAEAQVALAQARAEADEAAARARLDAARAQAQAAAQRDRLAQETRAFIDKSFRLGQSDLPTRLRVEAEASEARRQSARARLDVWAARSAWRQALGLLPQ